MSSKILHLLLILRTLFMSPGLYCTPAPDCGILFISPRTLQSTPAHDFRESVHVPQDSTIAPDSEIPVNIPEDSTPAHDFGEPVHVPQDSTFPPYSENPFLIP
jgi:hypothetical protein